MFALSEKKFQREVKFFVILVFLILFLRLFFYQHFFIPTGSMTPELLAGDGIVVDKRAYGYSQYSVPFHLPIIKDRIACRATPKRFEIIVFNNPADPKMDIIKRCVGLPGDKIQMRQGILYINDLACKYERLEDYPYRTPEGEVKMVEQYMEYFPQYDFKQRVIYIYGKDSGHRWNDTQEYVIPEGHYFVLGCNRHNSRDSRYDDPGFVPFKRIYGKAKLVFFSVDFGFYGEVSKPWTWYKVRLVPRFKRSGIVVG